MALMASWKFSRATRVFSTNWVASQSASSAPMLAALRSTSIVLAGSPAAVARSAASMVLAAWARLTPQAARMPRVAAVLESNVQVAE